MARSSGSKSGRSTKGGGLSSLLSSVWVRRLLWGVGTLAVLAFAVEGGEYGTSDLFTQKDRKAELEAELEELRDSVAVLKTELKAMTTDPVRLERVAREEYGMVKGEKEILYRLKSADSVRSTDSTRGGRGRVDEPVGVDSGRSVANIPRLPRGGAAW
ncbi:septum formation initiator family protein [Gemmatimonas aurantiaca]|uniref:FtsB family cell division protein n=1 Tax=Gemmatimonas aurantiaca TaxID=173480 RepID=UPI00301C4F53